METGTITKVFPDRGFCFIERQGVKVDLFAHVRDFDPDLPFDDTLKLRRVEFEIGQSDKGPRAVNVRAAE